MTSGSVNDKICVINDSERATALSADATVFCGQCGALAHDAKVVCHPMPFTKVGGKKG